MSTLANYRASCRLRPSGVFEKRLSELSAAVSRAVSRVEERAKHAVLGQVIVLRLGLTLVACFPCKFVARSAVFYGITYSYYSIMSVQRAL